ncbi:MAG: hypothetical protein KC560_16560 [Myxococcales bacterium]|nr:hypothetical protein [Myxococcales bacterium]
MQLVRSLPSAPSLRRAAATFAVVAGSALLAADADARIQSLGWQHADTSNVAGFRVYTRDVGGTYGVPAFDGMPAPDASGVYHFDLTLPDGSSAIVAVTAYDAQGLESPLSNERQYDPPAPPASPAPGGSALPTSYRVNVGGAAYTDSAGHVWEADGAYVSGGTAMYNSRLQPLATSDPFLFQSLRYDTDPATDIHYELPLPDGRYHVRLHFMEAWDEFVAGQRVFDVRVESQLVLDDLDLLAESPQWRTAITHEFDIDVTDGSLSVQLAEEVWQPTLSALEVALVSSTPIGSTGGGSTGGGATGGTSTGGGATGGGSSGGGSTGGTTTDPGTSPPLMGAPGQPQVAMP